MKLGKIAIILLSLIIIACKSYDEECCKKMDLEKFSIRVPNNWEYKKEKGIDSFIGKIKGTRITIHFDFSILGYANDLIPTKR